MCLSPCRTSRFKASHCVGDRGGSPAPGNPRDQLVRALVMRLEKITAEHALRIDPHRVDVVGTVLGIVVFDQRRGPMNAEIVRAARRRAAGPGEVQLFQVVNS